jgi:quercetin dioxygenase-like cupin family protein
MVHTGEEFAMVLEGTISFTIDGEEFLLKQGESIALKASVPHKWKNPAATSTKILWVVSPPPII